MGGLGGRYQGRKDEKPGPLATINASAKGGKLARKEEAHRERERVLAVLAEGLEEMSIWGWDFEKKDEEIQEEVAETREEIEKMRDATKDTLKRAEDWMRVLDEIDKRFEL